jgi:CRP/FNR family transcriptional regulator, cyclic AMP receptor protein
MLSPQAMRIANPNLALPEFKPGKVANGTTPLHPGWLPVLARVPLFASLSSRHLRRVADLAELRRYKHGAQIVREGAVGIAFYVILDGSAEVLTTSGPTKTLHEGDYFGELSLLDGARRAATVQAATSLAAARIARPAFLQLLKDERTLGAELAKGMLAIVRDLQGVRET